MHKNIEPAFYLGRKFDPKQLRVPSEEMALGSPFRLSLDDLLTHAIVLGMTGSGKTILGKIMIEEAALQGIPSILIDPKGDLASMKLVFPSLNREDFVPWIDARRGKDKEQIASGLSELYEKKLVDFSIPKKQLEVYKRKTKVVVLTPRSTTGIPLAISSLPGPPPKVRSLMKSEPETVLGLIDTVARTLLMRIFPNEPPEKHRTEEKFLNAVLRHAWENQISLEGMHGLETLVELIQNPPVKKIGAMEVDSYYPPRDRHELAKNINNLLVGVEQLWHIGIPLDIDLILDVYSRDGKTPIVIFNLSEISSLEDKIFTVSRIAYAVYEWMRRKGSSEEPRLIFYIDEIGGGGGKTAFFPIHPYNPPSKPPIMLLLKQARAFGVCCVFSTQNPGDIDYKGLSNCGIWIVGKLSTSRDREKVLQGLGDIELFGTAIDRRRLEKQIATLETGEFVCKTKQGDMEFFKERWLMSYHKTMTSKEIRESTDDRDRRSATTFLAPNRRAFFKLNHPASLKEIRRHFRESNNIHVERAECNYLPLLSFKIRTGFRKRHAFLSKEIETDLVYGPFLVPLFKDAVDVNFSAGVLCLEKTSKEDLLEKMEDRKINVVTEKLAIQDVFTEIYKKSRRKIKKEMMDSLFDQMEAEERRVLDAEKLGSKPEVDAIDFDIQNVNDQITDIREQISQIKDELGELRHDRDERLAKKEPVLMISRSIASRTRKIKECETRISKLQRKINTKLSQKKRISDSQKRKKRLIEEEFSSLRNEIAEEIEPKLTFENTIEKFIPICNADVRVLGHKTKRIIKFEWNGYNGSRITSFPCFECGTHTDRHHPLNLCSICLETLCEEHTQVCAECDRITCREHSWVCSCGLTHCTREEQTNCQRCESYLCAKCKRTCDICGAPLCSDHAHSCALCGGNICETHSIECLDCGKRLCKREDHHLACAMCGKLICRSCLTTCKGCGKTLCTEHSSKCPNCDNPICESCLRIEKKFLGLIKKKKCVACTKV